MIVFAPQNSAFGARAPGDRIDTDGFHRRKVDHEAVVAHGAARHVMAATPNRDRQASRLREFHRGLDVGYAGDSDDGGRPLIHHAVPDLACLIVSFTAAHVNAAAEGALQIFPHIDCGALSHGVPIYHGIG